jgi:hypothetical protein
MRRTLVRTHEEVVCIWTEAADFEELHQVKELAMDVAADLVRVRLAGREGEAARGGERLRGHRRLVRYPPQSVSLSL